MKFAFVLLWWTTLAGAFKWNCLTGPNYSLDHWSDDNGGPICVVENITLVDLQSSKDLDGSTPSSVLLDNILAAPGDLWKTEYFNSVNHLFITNTNISQILVPPTLKKLTLFSTNYDQFVLESNVEYQLEKISLYDMQLEEFPKDMHLLRKLNLITGHRVALKTLDMSSLSGITNLKIIKVPEGNISSVRLSGSVNLPSLTNLELPNNKLGEVPDGMQKLSALQVIDLSLNRITFLEMSCFNGLEHLQKLDLSYNPLTRISSLATVKLPNLETLSFMACHLDQLNVLHWEMSTMKVLNVGGNNLHQIENLQGRFREGLELHVGINNWDCHWLEENKIGLLYKGGEQQDRFGRCDSRIEGICCRKSEMKVELGELLETEVRQLKNENFALNANLLKLQKQVDEVGETMKKVLTEIEGLKKS
ncbi:leucine rich protein [Culex quinquefasciatus]|uniref:Leucine rich protein n=1 Tax=Culex quinquefasciatus TaxID=7176 RepID=B0WQL6_CULQU|nr:leucine rich protein [Culex quinquefasciatus]|eukprot:XP_001851000.1 leucine rich protein [Culex quinquefasciatus]